MTARCGACRHFESEHHGGDGIGECYAPREEGSAFVHHESLACPVFEPATAHDNEDTQ